MKPKKYKRHVVLGPTLSYDDEFVFSKAAYDANGTLAILCNHYDDEGELEYDYDDITVNLSREAQFPAGGNLAYIDVNNHTGIDAWLEEQGIAKTVGMGHSGFCSYPLMEFDAKWLEALPTVEEIDEMFLS